MCAAQLSEGYAEPAHAAAPASSTTAFAVSSGLTPKVFTFTWTLEGLTVASFTSAKPEDEWWSPTFSACGVRWRLFVRPNFAAPSNARGVGAFLSLDEPNCTIKLADTARLDVTVSSNSSAHDATQPVNVIFSSKTPLPDGATGSWGKICCAKHSMMVKLPHTYLPQGKLTVTVQLAARTFAAAPVPDAPSSTLASELGALLASGEDADVTFRAGGERFAAHSFVLALRCSALKPQLRGPLASKPPYVLTVPAEILPPVFKRLLEFVYTDALSMESPEEAQHLLHAASFYRLPRLQAICEKELHKALSPANVLGTLELAYLNSATELCESALRCAAENAAEVMMCESWAEFKVTHPELVDALMHTMAYCEPPKRIAVTPCRPAAPDAAAHAGQGAGVKDEPAASPSFASKCSLFKNK